MIQPFNIGDIVYIPAFALHCNAPLCTVVVGIDDQTIHLHHTGWISVDFFAHRDIKVATPQQILLYCDEKTLDMARLLSYTV